MSEKCKKSLKQLCEKIFKLLWSMNVEIAKRGGCDGF